MEVASIKTPKLESAHEYYTQPLMYVSLCEHTKDMHAPSK